jgi:4-amino-4-deoxy-L-arabinose transferase-like glycosyltransferase
MSRSIKSYYPLGLYLLAVILRLVALYQIAGDDPAFDQHPGSDQTAYVAQAKGLLAGTWPDGPFYFQPLYPFFLGGLHLLAGPDMCPARAAQAIVLSTGTLICFWLARRLHGERAAWIAGALYAVYPVFIFYDLVFLGAGLVTLAILGTAAALTRWVETGSWRWAMLAGALLGVAGGAQPALPAAAVFPAAALVWQYRLKAVKPVLMFALGLAVALSPYSLWNYRFTGQLTPASTSGALNFYIGNNRHANGQRDNPLAQQATIIEVRQERTDYMSAALADIRADPLRAIQLFARKAGMLWSNPELAQNVDYYADGRDRSPLLRAIPLNFYWVALMAVAGFILYRRDPRMTAMALLAVGITASNALFFISSRQRLPVVPILIVTAGVAIDLLIITAKALFANRKKALSVGGAFVASVLLLAAADWATSTLPRPVLVSQLPPGYHRLGAVNTATVSISDSLPALEPGAPYWITVYWQASGPLDRDYKTLVQVIDANGQKWAQGDHTAGETGFQYYQSSRWENGDILRDEFLIIPPDDLPAPFAAQIWIGLYDPDTGERLPAFLPDGSPAPDGVLKTQPVAVTKKEPLTLPPEAQPVNATIGKATLAGYQAALDTLTLTLTLYWQSGGPMAEDGVIFVHLFDQSGQFVLGADSKPRNGLYSTQVWQSGEGVVDEHRVDLPSNLPPGEYTIKVGAYDSATLNRLAVITANGESVADGVLTLGTVAVQK